jgi:hypothetical protein
MWKFIEPPHQSATAPNIFFFQLLRFFFRSLSSCDFGTASLATLHTFFS